MKKTVNGSGTPAEPKRPTHEEFVLLALEKLKNPKYKGVHVVYSGLNDAFREYFPGVDPVAVVNAMVEKGLIKKRPARGGALIYPANADLSETASASAALSRMGLGG